MEDGHQDEPKPNKPNHSHPPRQLVPAPGGEEEEEEEPSSEPGSKGRSMKIKIKMPPPNNSSPPLPPPRPLPGPGDLQDRSFGRYCCGKFFPTGKAWGGHKRHHGLKELKSNSSCGFEKPKLQPPKADEEDDGTCSKKQIEKKIKEVGVIKAGSDAKVSNGGGPPVCYMCGKSFPSMNALFGHMRFHRDRGWKGIKPPAERASVRPSPRPKPARSSPPSSDVRMIKNPTGGSGACLLASSTSTSDGSSSSYAKGARDDGVGGGGMARGIAGADDLMRYLPLGWTKKDKRGREGTHPLDYLLPKPPATTKEALPDDDEGGQAPPGGEGQKNDAEEAARSLMKIYGDPQGFPSEERDEDEAALLPSKRRRKDHGGGGEKEEETDVNNNGGEVGEPSSFRCDICNEVFTSRQALDDHKRSHNRVFEFDLNKPPQGE